MLFIIIVNINRFVIENLCVGSIKFIGLIIGHYLIVMYLVMSLGGANSGPSIPTRFSPISGQLIESVTTASLTIAELMAERNAFQQGLLLKTFNDIFLCQIFYFPFCPLLIGYELLILIKTHFFWFTPRSANKKKSIMTQFCKARLMSVVNSRWHVCFGKVLVVYKQSQLKVRLGPKLWRTRRRKTLDAHNSF